MTSEVFADIGNHERAIWWKMQALGPRYDDGKVGGALKDAIQSDLFEIGEDIRVERGSDIRPNTGLSILNQNSDHERYGQVDTWY